VNIYQGESSTASRNHFLGDFRMSDIPVNYSSVESIDISFSYNLNGMLDVTAIVVSTGQKAKLSINMQNQENGPEMPDEDDETHVTFTNWKDSPISDDYRAVIRRAERILKHLDEDDDDRDEIESLLDALKVAIADEDVDEADDLEDDLVDLLESLED